MTTFPFPAGPGGTLPVEYGALRASALPAVRLADGMEVRLAVRHADVLAVLTDPRFSRALAAALPGAGFGRNQRTGLLDLDPPAHAGLRVPLDRALGPDRVERWRPLLTSLVRERLGAFVTGEPPADLVGGFADPLAARSICVLTGLGEPAADEVAANIRRMLAGSADAATALRKLVAEAVAHRRNSPGDDIASTVLHGDPRLSEHDAQTVLFGLLISGYIGNRNALARHVFALLAVPGARGVLPALAGAPGRVAPVVEELLRYYPSGNDGLLRVVREPVTLSGVPLAPGTVVMPVVAAAARDPEVVDRPDEFVADRAPNPHLSLGRGTHGCPGEHLVRALFGIVLTELATSLPGLALAVPADEVRHTDDLLPMGVESLPVTW